MALIDDVMANPPLPPPPAGEESKLPPPVTDERLDEIYRLGAIGGRHSRGLRSVFIHGFYKDKLPTP